MSMLSLIATTLILGAEPSGASLDELINRWNTECQSAPETEGCNGVAAEIELGLYDLLRKMALNRIPIDRELLQAAAESNLPTLAKLGVSMLGEPKSEADRDALLTAVDHPVLAVRYIAARNLSQAKDPQWQTMEKWWSGWTLAASANGPQESNIPDPQPTPEQFGMTSFKYLDFHYYGSSKDRAMFTTTESVDSFVKRFGEKRRVVDSMDAMQSQMDALQPEFDALQKEMEAAGAANDMEKLTAALQKLETLGKKMNTTAADPLAKSYTVIMQEDKTSKRATSTIQVQFDQNLKRTVLIFWREGGWRS